MSFDCSEMNFKDHTNSPGLTALSKAAAGGPQPEHRAGWHRRAARCGWSRPSSCEGNR
jgi:hypothetical protein